ncbi:BatB protein, partial [Pseudomonas sp. GP01-A3]
QQPTQARPAQALYSAPLALALILSMLLVIQERWPDNALQRLFSKLSSKGRFLQPNPEWRERLKRLRLRRRR